MRAPDALHRGVLQVRDSIWPVDARCGSSRHPEASKNLVLYGNHDEHHDSYPTSLRRAAARRNESSRDRRTASNSAPDRVTDGTRRAPPVFARRLLVTLRVLHAGAASLRTRRVRPHRSGPCRTAFSRTAGPARRWVADVDRRRPARRASDGRKLLRNPRRRPHKSKRARPGLERYKPIS